MLNAPRVQLGLLLLECFELVLRLLALGFRFARLLVQIRAAFDHFATLALERVQLLARALQLLCRVKA